MTSQIGGWLSSLQWHVLPLGDRFVYVPVGVQTLATSGNEVAGDLPSKCAENVDYCHHTELADAPAARQVKIRLALAGSPVSRARLWESGPEAKKVASLGGA